MENSSRKEKKEKSKLSGKCKINDVFSPKMNSSILDIRTREESKCDVGGG